MDVTTWRAGESGERCPVWCAIDHTAEPPDEDTVEHLSQAISVDLAPTAAGDELQLEFTTYRGAEYGNTEPAHTQVHVATASRAGDNLHEYSLIHAPDVVDRLATQLEQAAGQIREWRDRLQHR